MIFRRATGWSREGVLAGVGGTLAVHALLVAVLLISSRGSSGPAPIVYSVNLVAAPAPTTSTARVVPPSVPPPPPAPPKVSPAPSPVPRRTPQRTPPPTVDPKATPAPPTRTQNQPVPGATPSTGTDVDNVRVQGVAFPYPDYLNRIVNEILRRWARPVGAGALEAEISFTVMRDGSVKDIRVLRSSRNYTFDLEAQGAVEQAAEDRAFGPLPAGWGSDILQVAFSFTPRRR